MNSMLQRHCARYIYVVPEGLRELMSDISREVLRSQPEEIHTFIADYLDALLITRENARVAARLVQSITEISEQIIDVLESTGIGRDDAEYLAKIMHETFKKYIDVGPGENKPPEALEQGIIKDILAAAHISRVELDNAATVIQEAFKKFKERKELEKRNLIGVIDWRVAARSAIHLYRQTGVSLVEANRAATMIKAAYKGYYTRQMMRKLAENASTTQLEESSVQEEKDNEAVETFGIPLELDKNNEQESDLVVKEIKDIIEDMLLSIERNSVLTGNSKSETSQAEGFQEILHHVTSSPAIYHEVDQPISDTTNLELIKETVEVKGSGDIKQTSEASTKDPTTELANISEKNIQEQGNDISPLQAESLEGKLSQEPKSDD